MDQRPVMKSPTREPKRQRTDQACVICLEVDEDDSPRVACMEDHKLCASCLSTYVTTKAEELKRTPYLAAKAETAEIAGDLATLERLAGACCCPLRGYGCNAAPLGDCTLAQHVSASVFQTYLEAKALLPVAKKVEMVLQEGAELALLVPNGYMCRRCHYGPVELEACSDLLAHHGELRGGSTIPLSNACPQCGWFAEDISQWPRWTPTARSAISEAQWAEVHATQDVAAAARRERVQAAEVARVRDAMRQRDEERRERRERHRLATMERDERDGGRHERRHHLLRQMMRLMQHMETVTEIPGGAGNHDLEEAQRRLLTEVAEIIMPPPPPPPPPPPALPPAVAQLEAGLGQAHAEREDYQARVAAALEARNAAIAAAVAAAPRGGLNPGAPSTRVEAPLPPARPQPTDTTVSRALLSRLTGFEADSQACQYYLDQAEGDVERAVRLAVQGVQGGHITAHVPDVLAAADLAAGVDGA